MSAYGEVVRWEAADQVTERSLTVAGFHRLRSGVMIAADLLDRAVGGPDLTATLTVTDPADGVARRCPDAPKVGRSDRERGSRRAGAGPVLNRLGTAKSEIAIPSPADRRMAEDALVECDRCHQIAARVSPIQGHCPICRTAPGRQRSRESMARRHEKHRCS